MTTERNGKETARRGPGGRFLPGTAPGPGRPRGARDRLRALVEALEEEARSLGEGSLERLLAKRALATDGERLLIGLLKGIYPPGLALDEEAPGKVIYSVELAGGVYTSTRIVEPLPNGEAEEDPTGR